MGSGYITTPHLRKRTEANVVTLQTTTLYLVLILITLGRASFAFGKIRVKTP